jgi:hypothetical protein
MVLVEWHGKACSWEVILVEWEWRQGKLSSKRSLSLSLGSWPHPDDINSDDLTRELNYSPFLTHSTVN